VRAAIVARRRNAETAILVISQYVEHTYATELLAEGGGELRLPPSETDHRRVLAALAHLREEPRS
jgi:hypothetical protein